MSVYKLCTRGLGKQYSKTRCVKRPKKTQMGRRITIEDIELAFADYDGNNKTGSHDWLPVLLGDRYRLFFFHKLDIDDFFIWRSNHRALGSE